MTCLALARTHCTSSALHTASARMQLIDRGACNCRAHPTSVTLAEHTHGARPAERGAPALPAVPAKRTNSGAARCLRGHAFQHPRDAAPLLTVLEEGEQGEQDQPGGSGRPSTALPATLPR